MRNRARTRIGVQNAQVNPTTPVELRFCSSVPYAKVGKHPQNLFCEGAGMTTEERWETVGRAVRSRMTEQGITQGDLVAATGLSRETVRPVMQGRPSGIKPVNLSKISRALDWPHTTITDILDGEDPPLSHEDRLARARSRVVQLQEDLDELTNIAMGLSAAGRGRLLELAHEMLDMERAPDQWAEVMLERDTADAIAADEELALAAQGEPVDELEPGDTVNRPDPDPED